MRHFKAEIKEKGNPCILRPSFIGEKTQEELEEFWGVGNSDVEWFKISEVPYVGEN